MATCCQKVAVIVNIVLFEKTVEEVNRKAFWDAKMCKVYGCCTLEIGQ